MGLAEMIGEWFGAGGQAAKVRSAEQGERSRVLGHDPRTA